MRKIPPPPPQKKKPTKQQQQKNKKQAKQTHAKNVSRSKIDLWSLPFSKYQLRLNDFVNGKILRIIRKPTQLPQPTVSESHSPNRG